MPCREISENVPKKEKVPLEKFKVENITVTRAPLLKVYYWEHFDIIGLNNKLETEEVDLHHIIRIPSTQLNSKPLKVIFWLRNVSHSPMELRLRRIKNCDCTHLETRVGFNQFRQLYHCPHRRLIHILQEYMLIKPQEIVAMSVITYFFLYGEHKLTYEMSCAGDRLLTLDFMLDIIGFDPLKCIITNELIPSDLKEFQRFVQPIWVQNMTMQHFDFHYTTRARGLKIINPNLTVPRQSVWPLMVEYRPSDFENLIEIYNNFETVALKLFVPAKGVLDLNQRDIDVPKVDFECVDFPYVLYPNKLEFELELNESRSLMVCLRNNNQKCMEFRWQHYIINDLFEVIYEPEVFRLKQHHSQLCIVQVRVFDHPLHFKRIPTVLEVHKIFSKNTRIARELLEEVESIDDPRWADESYMEHVFLHVDIKVNFKKKQPIELNFDPAAFTKKKLCIVFKTTTVFEKCFWEYLCKGHFMRENTDPKIDDQLSYQQVMLLGNTIPPAPVTVVVTKNEILEILSQLLAEGLREFSKNWRFLPIEHCFT